MQDTCPFQYHYFCLPLYILVTLSPDGSLPVNTVKVVVSLNNQAVKIRVSVVFTCAAD